MANTSTRILVDPDKLRTSAKSFEDAKKLVQNRATLMMQLVNGLSSKWQGEASNAYRTKFNKLQGDIQQMMAMIDDYINDLNSIAALYDNTESTNVNNANQLMDDVIK